MAKKRPPRSRWLWVVLMAGGTLAWLKFLSWAFPLQQQQGSHEVKPSAVAGHKNNKAQSLSRLYDELRGDLRRKSSDDTAKRRNATTTVTKTTTTCSQDSVIALTYASHGGRDDRFCRSVESAIWNGVDLRVLGWGVPWEGLSQKLAAALEAVSALDGDCVVVFVDAYDVLFAESLAAMRRKFDAMPSPLVFSGECGCWPHVQRDNGKTCRDDYPASPTPYRYLNSGSWIGKADVAAKFLQRLVDTTSLRREAFHKLNDQELAAELYFSRQFLDLALDHAASMFMPMHAVHDRTLVPDCDPWPHLTEKDGVWRNDLTGTTPSVFHFNGGGKKHHLPMEARMWWKQCNEAVDPAVVEAVSRTQLLFHDRLRAFDDVCPGHLRRQQDKRRDCGPHVARMIRENLRRLDERRGSAA